MKYEQLVEKIESLMEDYEVNGPGDVELTICRSPEGVIPDSELIWNGNEFETNPINWA